MAKIKNLGIKKIYEKKLKENEDLRNKLKESDAELSELKKLYYRQLKWQETGEQLKIEVSNYL